MESNSVTPTPTPSPATEGTQSSIGTTPSETPISTPNLVTGSQVPAIENAASVPPPTSASVPPPASASVPPSDSVKRKNQSIAWEHFTRLTNPDGSKLARARAKCKHCPQTYAVDSKSNGTTNMRTHLLYQCRKSPLFIPAKKQRYLAFDSAENGGNVVSIEFDKDTSRFACARMIIKDELPFSHVEGQGFIDFMRVTQPKFKTPSRRTIARDIWELYQGEKGSLKRILAAYNQRVSLTTDTWTSIQNINYMVLTAHFIDEDWVLHKRILNFVVIPNHKGKTIGKLVETCLIGWGIEKVFTIVVDNASSNQVALDYMREKIGNWDELVLNGSFLHMRCCCHILNLIVRDGMEELDSSIEAIRNCVKYIRGSPARLEKFRKCAAQEKIEYKGWVVPLDVCTRWNSTYFMLEIAVKFKKAFMRLEDEDTQFENYFQERVAGKKRDGPPQIVDWEKAARLVKFLKIFYDATLQFSGTKVVTANQPLLWMCTIVAELEKCLKSDDPLMASIGTSMKTKFDKYWSKLEDMNKILLIVVVLDPRYKMLYLEYFFPKLQQDKNNGDLVGLMVSEVKSMFLKLFKAYAASDPEAAQASLDVTLPKSANAIADDCEDSHAQNIQGFKKLRQEKDVVEIKDEVDKYLLEAAEDPANLKFDLLGWWKENAPRYPILSQIARDVFAVPASTVASESAFSLGKRVVDPFRASLTPRMVECLVCSSDWLRANSLSFYKEPTTAELEMYTELEKLESEIGVANAAEVED